MKKSILLAAAALIAMQAGAQETYENARLANEDLNGTARYVGMGGAMEALGADISTMSTNPAGIGMFRHNIVNGTVGLVAQHDAQSFNSANKTNVSFDQLGFVYTMRTGEKSFLNFGFNYHKSKNFDFILSASDKLSNASQNKLTYEKYRNGVFNTTNDVTYNQLDHFYMQNLLYDKSDNMYYNYPASQYDFDRSNTGYIGEYDFNISGDINDRVYLGVTAGIHDVHYKGYSEYFEDLSSTSYFSEIGVADSRKITGTGFDVKFGVIFRPVESSPFRIGLYVNTPVWYDLTTSNNTQYYQTASASTSSSTLSSAGNSASAGMSKSYDFKFYTPWKFGVSLGHTIGNYLALGATYEYADYSKCDMRINTGTQYDWDGYAYDTSSSDDVMNNHISNTLKGVSTLKLGLEFRPDPAFAVRLGYNYVSPMYNEDGYKDGSLSSPGSYYSSATDYTNWKATNRITCGMGFKTSGWNFDIAYQYSQTDGDFYPFRSYYNSSNSSENNICDAVKVSNKRSQVLLSVGYTF